MYGESIYNLVPLEYTAPQKAPMHRSSHNPTANVAGSTFGCRGTTRLPGAGAIVKKEGAFFGPRADGTGKRSISPGKKTGGTGEIFTYSDRRKGNVPSKEDIPIMGIHTTKNFITANAVEAILQVPRNVELGEKKNYMLKEDFGKVPKYLTQVKEEIRRENDMIDKYVKKQMGEIDLMPQQFEEMDENERQELLSALKNKWDFINAKYQKITHLVQLDTTGQVRRKELLEGQLTALEKDIEKLQKMGPVLIY